MRSIAAILAFVVVFATANTAVAQRTRGLIVPDHVALRHGLRRAWATQIEIDPSRGRVVYVTLHDGLLLVQTDQTTIHALDPETRSTKWVSHVGKRHYPVTPAASNAQYVASTNGSTLYLLDRKNGGTIWNKRLDTAPSAGVLFSDTRLYVPLITGDVTSYRLPDKSKGPEAAERLLDDIPLRYRGTGMSEAQPLLTGTTLVWGTDKGLVYSATREELGAKFRFRARGPVSAALAYRSPYVFAASRDGYVYALHEQRGTPLWQFSSGNPISQGPIVLGDWLYVIPEAGGMFRLSAETGEEQWYAPGVHQFYAASPTRMYTTDLVGRTLILDVETGARISTLSTEAWPIKVHNTRTDRLYICNGTGLIQCLHEVGLSKPFEHPQPVLVTPEEADKAKPAAAPVDAAAVPAADADDAALDEAEAPAEDEGPDPFADPAEDDAAGDEEAMPDDADAGDADAEMPDEADADAEGDADAEMPDNSDDEAPDDDES